MFKSQFVSVTKKEVTQGVIIKGVYCIWVGGNTNNGPMKTHRNVPLNKIEKKPNAILDNASASNLFFKPS
jgi:hypothetical protein